MLSSLAATPTVGLLVFVAWALAPYALLAIAGPSIRRPWVIAGAGAAAIAAEAGFRLAAFVYPRGSTAGLVLIFSPAFVTVVALPAGALAGWLVDRAMRSRSRLAHGSALALAAAALALTTLGLARPDLFPTTVYARRRALDRIGPLGVRVGADTLTPQVLTADANWRQVADLDGRPGDEIAIVDRGIVRVLSPDTLVTLVTAPLWGDARRWNWFSRLTRVGGRLMIAETGGGFQETRVRALDGSIAWTYRPDAALPPAALVPADLDGDGDAEFVALTSDALVRLDGAGREVWRRTARLDALLTVLPHTRTHAAWIVAVDPAAAVRVWDEHGGAVATVPVGDARGLGAVEWQGSRDVLAVQEHVLRGLRLDGRVRWTWTVPDMAVVEAATVRVAPDGLEYLALVAAAPRDTRRWRLQVLGPDRRLVYDEVRDSAMRLLAARGPDGTDTLLVSGSTLVALRPSGTQGRVPQAQAGAATAPARF